MEQQTSTSGRLRTPVRSLLYSLCWRGSLFIAYAPVASDCSQRTCSALECRVDAVQAGWLLFRVERQVSFSSSSVAGVLSEFCLQKKWARRYFVLKDNVLFMYREEKDIKGQYIRLNGASIDLIDVRYFLPVSFSSYSTLLGIFCRRLLLMAALPRISMGSRALSPSPSRSPLYSSILLLYIMLLLRPISLLPLSSLFSMSLSPYASPQLLSHCRPQ